MSGQFKVLHTAQYNSAKVAYLRVTGCPLPVMVVAHDSVPKDVVKVVCGGTLMVHSNKQYGKAASLVANKNGAVWQYKDYLGWNL